MAEVIFKSFLVDDQNYNFENEDRDFMVSKIELSYKNENFTVEIKQPHGVNFEQNMGMELLIDKNDILLKELSYNDFSDKCEEYVREFIGKNGSLIRIEGGASNISMSNVKFQGQPRYVEIALALDNGTTW